MMQGKVKCWRPERSYGFLLGDDGNEYFCPGSTVGRAGLIDDLKDGDRVRFDSRPDRSDGPLPYVFYVERA